MAGEGNDLQRGVRDPRRKRQHVFAERQACTQGWGQRAGVRGWQRPQRQGRGRAGTTVCPGQRGHPARAVPGESCMLLVNMDRAVHAPCTAGVLAQLGARPLSAAVTATTQPLHSDITLAGMLIIHQHRCPLSPDALPTPHTLTCHLIS